MIRPQSCSHSAGHARRFTAKTRRVAKIIKSVCAARIPPERRSPGFSQAQALAREIQGRYNRSPAGIPAVMMAFRQAQAAYSWASSLHLHLAPRLGLAVLAGSRQPLELDERRMVLQPDVSRVQAGPQPQPVQTVLRVPPQAASTTPLTARLHTRSLRIETPGSHSPEQAPAQRNPAAPSDRAFLPVRPAPHGPAPRVLLSQAVRPSAPSGAAAPQGPAQAFPNLPAHPRAGSSSPAPVLHLEQLPPHELNRLAERVAQTIDRRILAQRERLGRV
jgi:hypothetical protein